MHVLGLKLLECLAWQIEETDSRPDRDDTKMHFGENIKEKSFFLRKRHTQHKFTFSHLTTAVVKWEKVILTLTF